jgi:hypothetical protein
MNPVSGTASQGQSRPAAEQPEVDRVHRGDEWKAVVDEWLGIKPRPCSHSWRHTVYGASDARRNGTTCVLCGEKL